MTTLVKRAHLVEDRRSASTHTHPLVVGILFVLAPRLGLRLYGVDPDENKAAAYPLRYLGARSLLVAGLLADDDLADAVLDKAPLIAAGDGVATSRPCSPGRSLNEPSYLEH